MRFEIWVLRKMKFGVPGSRQNNRRRVRSATIRKKYLWEFCSDSIKRRLRRRRIGKKLAGKGHEGKRKVKKRRKRDSAGTSSAPSSGNMGTTIRKRSDPKVINV